MNISRLWTTASRLFRGLRVILDANGPARFPRQEIALHRTDPCLGEGMTRGLPGDAATDQECNTKAMRDLVINGSEAWHGEPPQLLPPRLQRIWLTER